jgi:hypothetical protein
MQSIDPANTGRSRKIIADGSCTLRSLALQAEGQKKAIHPCDGDSKERNIAMRKILMAGTAAMAIILGGAQAYAANTRMHQGLTTRGPMIEGRAAFTGAAPYYSHGFGADRTWADVGMAPDTSGDYSRYF